MLANFYYNVFGLPLSVWISDETVLVFDISLPGVCIPVKHSFQCSIYYFSAFGYQCNTPSCACYITSWCLDTSVTLLLVFDISLLGVWISDETLHIVFHVLLLSAWISDERILRVFYILLRILETEQFFLCWIYYLQKFFLRKIGQHNFFLLGPHIFEG